MKIRLLKRSAVIKNMLIFQFFSLVYLQIIKSLHLGISAFKWNSFLEMLQARPWILLSFLLAFISVYLATKFSSLLFGLFCLVILGESIFYLFESFDKLILVLTFFYSICSMYFLLFWGLEKKEAIYRPSFDKNSIGLLDEYNLSVDVESPFGPIKGNLTNWDEHSCFLIASNFREDLKGKILFKVFFEDLEFQCRGDVVTKYASGYGVRIEETSETLNWRSFYDIVSDRGYKPRYV